MTRGRRPSQTSLAKTKRLIKESKQLDRGFKPAPVLRPRATGKYKDKDDGRIYEGLDRHIASAPGISLARTPIIQHPAWDPDRPHTTRTMWEATFINQKEDAWLKGTEYVTIQYREWSKYVEIFGFKSVPENSQFAMDVIDEIKTYASVGKKGVIFSRVDPSFEGYLHSSRFEPVEVALPDGSTLWGRTGLKEYHWGNTPIPSGINYLWVFAESGRWKSLRYPDDYRKLILEEAVK